MAKDYSEEYYLPQDRKASRKQRKIIAANDRSKYKKTDQDKTAKQEKIDTKILALPQGRVLSVTSEGITVSYQSTNYLCSLRGKLKKEKTRVKNLVTVGDFVRFEIFDDNSGSIAYVEDRKSYLSRAENLDRQKEQLIAANIDQVLITASVITPPLKPSLIDRYLVAAGAGNMEPIILINKVDLLNGEDHDFASFLETYRSLGYTIIPLSIITGQGLDELEKAMKDKASVFAGQSGVGKSSLINALTGLELAVGETVEHSKKGSHTTTNAKLVPLKSGGWCIDTPGIKSFGLWNIPPEELSKHFHEIHSKSSECRFHNCTHIHEPGCAVIQGVQDGDISSLRYNSYISLLESMQTEHKRR